ncbi:DUF3467 domain-containing protein [Zavarzinella formosa]|uniref:DUF3467 domain-containing protein n=1 Tax=Zavarzinella formosa TaxID=360055 RepID=UPI0004966E1E|nr:DUF3467 domain-containing protein [Zavarzinella formosa]
MSEEAEGSSGAIVPVPPSPQPMRLEVSTTGMNTTYSNFFRLAGTFEELLLDFGFHSGLVVGNTTEPAKIGHRVILNFPTAKRLLGALQAAVQRHEQTFGPIETDPQKRVRRS